MGKAKKTHALLKQQIEKQFDRFWFIGNALCAELHLIYSAMKSGNPEYLKRAGDVRRVRSLVMRDLLTNKEFDVYCFAKHAAGMVVMLFEIAEKEANEAKVKEYLDAANLIFDMWWWIQQLKGKLCKSTS